MRLHHQRQQVKNDREVEGRGEVKRVGVALAEEQVLQDSHHHRSIANFEIA